MTFVMFLFYLPEAEDKLHVQYVVDLDQSPHFLRRGEAEVGEAELPAAGEFYHPSVFLTRGVIHFDLFADASQFDRHQSFEGFGLRAEGWHVFQVYEGDLQLWVLPVLKGLFEFARHHAVAAVEVADVDLQGPAERDATACAATSFAKKCNGIRFCVLAYSAGELIDISTAVDAEAAAFLNDPTCFAVGWRAYAKGGCQEIYEVVHILFFRILL